MEPPKVTLRRAKETKNTVRYEEPESDQPLVIGTLYLQKWAAHRLDDPETITVTIAPPEKPEARAPGPLTTERSQEVYEDGANDPRAVVEALAKHEEALSALYAAFVAGNPEAKSLWQTMSREEYGHARLLRSLSDRVGGLAVVSRRPALRARRDHEGHRARALDRQGRAQRRLPLARSLPRGVDGSRTR